MKARTFLFPAAGVLAAGVLLAAAAPTPEMFRARVVAVDAQAPTMRERAVQACRGRAGEEVFLAALAFPSARGFRSGCGRQPADPVVGVTVDGSGRIRLGDERHVGRSLDDERAAPADSWGVLLASYRKEGGRCRALDVQVLAADRAYDLGERTLLWLGEAGGDQALGYLAALRSDLASRAARDELVFALYLLESDGAVPALIDLARHDPEGDVRKDAVFWLGQRASSAAVKALGDVIDSPESMEIKKHAVFSLSQLAHDKGTPLLLEIARNNPHPSLRKAAIFWLGESGDPRALEYFEEVLLK